MADENQVINQDNQVQEPEDDGAMEYYRLFIPLAKVDEERREVSGFATVEEPDTAGEVMDYATSKPYFVDWSNQALKRSGGKSKGNVRAMHSNIAAGKLVSMMPSDERKAVFVTAKVVSDEQWNMVKEGVYTGFSVGGRYVKRWYDNGYMRYTAQPLEISLVDSPAVRSATFQMVKADGTTAEVPFRKVDAPQPGTMTADDIKLQQSPATFSPVTININMPPSSGALMSAGNPNAQVVSMEANASPATDKGASPPGQNEAAYKGDAVQETPMADELEKADPISQAKAILSGVTTADPQTSNAIAQAMAVLETGVQHAPLAQDTTIAANAAQAASDRGVTVTSNGPTTQVSKAGGDPSYPSSTGTDTTTPTGPEKSSSTPGKSTPTAMESDTKPTTSTSTPSTMGKAEAGDDTMADIPQEPLSTVPTGPAVMVSGQSVVEQHLPEFMKALEGGSLRKAQQIVRDINGGYFDQSIFDEMFMKSQYSLLNQGGWTYSNLQRGNLGLYGAKQLDDEGLKKAIALADMPNVYLIRLIKLMLPLYAGLRRRLPSNPPAVGSNQAQWRAELGFSNFDFAAAMSVAEASVGGSISESFLNFASPFKRISLNDAVTLEAVYGARGYDDPLQVAVIRALTLLLGSEERKILGDNSGSIPAPSSVVMTASSTGGTLAAGSYIPYVTALTYRGWLGTTKAGSPAGYGESTTGSAAQVVTTGSLSSISLSWAAVKGAAAYSVYLSQNGTNRYVGTFTANSIAITAFPNAGASYPAADSTANANGFEGILNWCDLSTIYGNVIPNKSFIDQAGSGLTTYAGGISEFDTLLSALWTNWQIAPSLILTSPDGAKHLTAKLLSTSAVSAYRIEVGQERGQINGGAFVTGYTNKFAPYADGTPRVIDIMAHPYMPNGTFKFITESIPYPMARESRGFVLETLIPYTYFPLAQNDIRYPFAMLCSETLECFHPGAQASINGVDFNK